MTQPPPASETSPEDQVLAVALQLMRPFSRLLIAQGLKYGEAAEVLKRAFVESGRAALEQAGTMPNVSRISVSTGLHRQDIKRLLETSAGPIARGRSLAGEVYTRWLTDPAYRIKGRPRDLPMRATGDRPSFEKLARAVSTDVHPRTIGEELRRLRLVEPVGADLLRISPEGFVPINERAGMLGFLGDNVGDHFEAAVGNVLGDRPRVLEQSVYADQLDDAGVAAADARVREIWRQTMDALVPLLETLIARSRDPAPSPDGATAPPRRRLRIGMYMHSEAMTGPRAAPGADDDDRDDAKERP